MRCARTAGVASEQQRLVLDEAAPARWRCATAKSQFLAAQQKLRAAAQRCAAQETMADLRQRLVAFYQRHNPTNLAQIDAILTAWGHNEAELWRQMAAKYGQRADQQQAAQGQREPNAEPKSNRYRPAENRNYSDQQRVGQLRSDMFNVMAAAGLR